jgi:hypothetical protein
MKNNKSHGEKLYDKIGYKKILWTGGFVKTVAAAALMSNGVAFTLNALAKHPFLIRNQEMSIYIGLGSTLLALLIVYAIDKYREHYKKQELNIICEEVQKEAQKIAQEKVLDELKKIKRN